MTSNRRYTRSILLGATALAGALSLSATQASAQERRYDFDLPAQPLNAALQTFARQAQLQVIFAEAETKSLRAPSLSGSYSADEALQVLLAGTDLKVSRTSKGVLQVAASPAPQGGSAAGGGAEVEALIVTAQKREEDIQDVPIAISAFTQEDLTRSQVAGGPDLITQVPNMTFTKTNFSSYSIQIRGIGTQAISATTDPAVAVAFNNTPFIRNRFFEQEFYDLQRVEVLRGPQGTLYGRNATAGVVNIISAKPRFQFEAKASADVSNYSSSRIEGMVNFPIVEDAVALRIAGAWTKRDGYATNEITGKQIDGRDLWSTRVSLRLAPTERMDINLIWEHFQEDDDRLRSGKQLCKKHVVSEVGNVANIPYLQTLPNRGQVNVFSGVQGTFSQGCERNSLYAEDSFQTVNGLSIPYYAPLAVVGLPAALTDPYVSAVQSQDLRVIESTVDPTYRAKSDLGELQVSFDLTDDLTLQSETAYGADVVFSVQDFNRFNTASGAWRNTDPRPGVITPGPNGGIFCDPQIGCADRLVAMDLSTAKSRQFSQELRLSSDFDSAFNFSLGANYLRYDTEDKYYVFINSLTLSAAGNFSSELLTPYIPGESDNSECMHGRAGSVGTLGARGPVMGDPSSVYSVLGCIYIDPNPIGALNDEGHNYFLSKNPYKLISYAVFGEGYYNITDNLKVTAGLRWTVDKKEAPRIPSWVLAAKSVGYPVAEVIEQEWNEPTGRLTIDWKPDFAFTDETLLYASFAHGYKAGGANPPGFVRVFYADAAVAQGGSNASATRPKTFDAEFIDAFELGAKNTLANGTVTLNLAAFYYDYTGYQVSEIVDRSAFNRNFDATVWGIELEADWRPLENLKLGFKGGYQKTRIKDGQQAIDLADRTAGNPDWVVVRPFPTFASNCVLPVYLFAHDGPSAAGGLPGLYGVGGVGGGNMGGCELAYQQGFDPVTERPYEANPTGSAGSLSLFWYPGTYPGFNPNDESQGHNHGEGFFKQLGGNELPNAPNWTFTGTADYTIPLPNDWLATLHTDLHWQSESWWRVFNDHEHAKLDEYFTMNLAAIFVNEEAGWNVMAYVKNVTDVTAITGAFLFSDDTGLTTNVFLTEPRLYGIRVTKAWTGNPWWNSDGREHPAGEPYALTVEIGGQVQQQDAPNADVRPSFLDNFSPTLQPAGVQNRPLDWGDGREVKLTYAPQGSTWRVLTGWRMGEANRGDKFVDSEEGDRGCLLNPNFCIQNITFVGTNYVRGTVSDREEHELIDFMVGREFGLGASGVKSTLMAGLRYAAFNSRTRLDMEGVPDWNVPAGNSYYYEPIEHHHYQADFKSNREFEGVGPVISWEVSKRLLGQDESHLDMEASIQGGVLFGKQNTSVEGDEEGAFFSGVWLYRQDLSNQVGPTIVMPGPDARSESRSVPIAGASLGLSYQLQRLKLSGGYRWERYFDVLDVGFGEVKDADRTIDGPYFKIAVGFGG